MKAILSLALLALLAVAVVWAIVSVVSALFENVDPTLSAAILAAATTVIVSTLTIVLGRYFERKKDLESAHRQNKTEIYDAFLQEFFRLFYEIDTAESNSEDLIRFLREWQRKKILWGGQGVISAYLAWMRKLKQGTPDAQAMFLAEDFFRAMRKDLGHSNFLLPRGTFIHFLLREADMFLAISKKNPKVKLSELAELEKRLELGSSNTEPKSPTPKF